MNFKGRQVYYGVVNPPGERDGRITSYLSQSQLVKAANLLRGCPIYIEHQQKTVRGKKAAHSGLVVGADVHPKTKELWAAFVLVDSPNGKLAKHLLEDSKRPMKELSLGYKFWEVVLSNKLRIPVGHEPTEVSICHKGCRENTIIKGKVPFEQLFPEAAAREEGSGVGGYSLKEQAALFLTPGLHHSLVQPRNPDGTFQSNMSAPHPAMNFGSSTGASHGDRSNVGPTNPHFFTARGAPQKGPHAVLPLFDEKAAAPDVIPEWLNLQHPDLYDARQMTVGAAVGGGTEFLHPPVTSETAGIVARLQGKGQQQQQQQPPKRKAAKRKAEEEPEEEEEEEEEEAGDKMDEEEEEEEEAPKKKPAARIDPSRFVPAPKAPPGDEDDAEEPLVNTSVTDPVALAEIRRLAEQVRRLGMDAKAREAHDANALRQIIEKNGADYVSGLIQEDQTGELAQHADALKMLFDQSVSKPNSPLSQAFVKFIEAGASTKKELTDQLSKLARLRSREAKKYEEDLQAANEKIRKLSEKQDGAAQKKAKSATPAFGGTKKARPAAPPQQQEEAAGGPFGQQAVQVGASAMTEFNGDHRSTLNSVIGGAFRKVGGDPDTANFFAGMFHNNIHNDPDTMKIKDLGGWRSHVVGQLDRH